MNVIYFFLNKVLVRNKLESFRDVKQQQDYVLVVEFLSRPCSRVSV